MDANLKPFGTVEGDVMKPLKFSAIAIFVVFVAAEASANNNIQACSTYRDRCSVNGKADECAKFYSAAVATGVFKGGKYFDQRMNEWRDVKMPCRP
jgi:hypothetical protein